MKHTIIKNGVTFEIEQQADRYNQMSVIARLGEHSQRGTIPGDSRRVYPRIEFKFCNRAQWLHKFADRRSWAVDEYESPDETEKRPFDHCDFTLTSDETDFLTSWRMLRQERSQPATNTRPDHSQEFGIGRISDTDQPLDALAQIEAAEINRRNAPKRKITLCDCGHHSALPMSTSSGTSCPDCYDRMSL